MGIGAQSSFYRRALYRFFESRDFRRTARTDDGVFQAYVSPSSTLSVLDVRKSLVDPIPVRFIRARGVVRCGGVGQRRDSWAVSIPRRTQGPLWPRLCF